MENYTEKSNQKPIVVSALKSMSLLWKYRKFYPQLGDHFREHMGDVVQYHLRGKRYYITNPEMAQKVYRLDYRKAVKPNDPYDSLAPYQGNGLVLSEGPDWIKQRRWAAPHFLRSAFPEYLSIMVSETESLIQEWQKSAESGASVNLVTSLNRTTFRILCRCILGHVLDSKLDLLYKGINETIVLLPKRIFAPFYTNINTPLPTNLQIKRSAKRYRQVIAEIIQEAKTSGQAGMLSHLLKQKEITDEEMIDMVSTMVGAGFETTANLLSWTFVLLCQNLEAQERLRNELTPITQKNLTLEALENAEYLEAVMNESLRMYPPLLVPSRRMTEAVDIDGYHFEKGSNIDLSIWAVQHHPDYWKNPNQFLPERFLKENLDPRSLAAFFPFVVGPRECIGKQFALLEARVILSLLLSKFEFKLADGVKVEPEALLVLRPRGGVRCLIRGV